MFNLSALVRSNILSLQPYSSARDEYEGEGIFIDANENPYGDLNRYPDPQQKKLKKELGTLKEISSDSIFIGNGSDEAIDLIYRIFCEPQKDKALVFSPSYGMYQVSAQINDVEVTSIPLTVDFQIDLELVTPYFSSDEYKVIFICSPNNPSGNRLRKKSIIEILNKFSGIVVIDEAYADFCGYSYLESLASYPNLIVLQTFSKARGMAAARVGMAFSSPKIISLFNKIKPPYNISLLNQDAALKSLANQTDYQQGITRIIRERELLISALEPLDMVVKIYPSNTNFILIKMKNAESIYNWLLSKKIITRNRNHLVQNCLRITVGTSKENQFLIQSLQKFTS